MTGGPLRLAAVSARGRGKTGLLFLVAFGLWGCPPPPAASPSGPTAALPKTLFVPHDSVLSVVAASADTLLTGPVGGWLFHPEGALAAALNPQVADVLHSLPPERLARALGIDAGRPVTLGVRPAGDVVLQLGVASPSAFARGLDALADKSGATLSERDGVSALYRGNAALLLAHISGPSARIWIGPTDALGARAALLAGPHTGLYRSVEVPRDAAVEAVYVPGPVRGELLDALEAFTGPVRALHLRVVLKLSAPVVFLTALSSEPVAPLLAAPALCSARVSAGALAWGSVPARAAPGAHRFAGLLQVAAGFQDDRMGFVVEGRPADPASAADLLASVRAGVLEAGQPVREIANGIVVANDGREVLRAEVSAERFRLIRDAAPDLLRPGTCPARDEFPFFLDAPALRRAARAQSAEAGLGVRLGRALSPLLAGLSAIDGGYRVKGGAVQVRFSSPAVDKAALWWPQADSHERATRRLRTD